MTRKQLQKTLSLVVCFYAIVIIGGFALFYLDSTEKRVHYQIFKDLIPFTLAIPAAYLGYCFQRRASYMQALRQLWISLINSVNSSIQYTFLTETTEKQYSEALILLSKSIDEVRGVYTNIDETKKNIGLYPFEGLKKIYELISKLGYGNIERTKAVDTRNQIMKSWKELRKPFLSEFDRSEPTNFNSPYMESK